MIERLVKGPVITKSAPVVEAALHDDLKRLRADLAGMVGSVIATRDGLLIAADLPSGIEPNGMAALTASQLALGTRIAATGLPADIEFHEVAISSSGGHIVVYSAGPYAALTILAEPSVNLGRLHLESRPLARHIAERLAAVLGTEPR